MHITLVQLQFQFQVCCGCCCQIHVKWFSVFSHTEYLSTEFGMFDSQGLGKQLHEGYTIKYNKTIV